MRIIAKTKRGKYEEWLTEDGLKKIRGWARDGFSDIQIAESIGIARTMLYSWKKKYPDIADAIKKGRAPVVIDLEDALYRSALGYEDIEEITEIYEEGGVQKKHIRKVKRNVPPNVTALIFSLKNLRKDKFRDKPIDDTIKNDDVLIELIRKWDEAAKNLKESKDKDGSSAENSAGDSKQEAT